MKKALSIIAIIFLMVMTAGYTFAGSKTAIMHVRVSVLPIAKYTILHQESNFIVTKADIDKGYVDVRKAMTLSIKTNSTNGYLLMFSVGSGHFKGLTVFEGNNTHKLSKSGGEVHMPYQKNYVTKELSFRFHLSSDAKPGTYQWPVALMISAI